MTTRARGTAGPVGAVGAPRTVTGSAFVVPSFPSRSGGIDSRWLAASGLAAALAARMDGGAVVSPLGVDTPEEAAGRAVGDADAPAGARRALRRLPRMLRVAAGDAREWRRAQQFRRMVGGLRVDDVSLVVQLHHRFQDAGLRMARRADAPSVLRVEALEVREERAWGVHRPMWGSLVERWGELGPMSRADLIAPVSETLDRQLAELGIPDARRVVIPNGVDVARFGTGHAGHLRERLGLGDRFVVGWVGGFRPFHGLEAVAEVGRALAARVPQATLVLIGDGPLRDRVARSVRSDNVRILPPVSHDEMPRYLAAFDAALLLASGGPFHYSPLKLYEYLAAGLPVIGPAVGDVGPLLSRAGIVTDQGDPVGVAAAVEALAGDLSLTRRLGERARALAETECSWGSRADALLAALRERGRLEER